MKRCRTAILISGSGSNLQAFIDAVANDGLPLDITSVLSNVETAFGLERARQAGIDAVHVDHRQFVSREAFDRHLAAALDPYAPELIILAGFMRILSPWFVHRFAGRIVNVHPALLPLYPGLNTHARAISAGDKWHGSTVHFVTDELDGGPRIVQGRLQINADDTPESLTARVQRVEHRIYPLAARWFAEQRLILAADGPRLDGEALLEPAVIDFADSDFETVTPSAG